MPNTAAPAQHITPANQRGGDAEKEQSPAEYSSGIDSDNDLVGSNGSGNTRALKRKRPLTVSYVSESAMLDYLARA